MADLLEGQVGDLAATTNGQARSSVKSKPVLDVLSHTKRGKDGGVVSRLRRQIEAYGGGGGGNASMILKKKKIESG